MPLRKKLRNAWYQATSSSSHTPKGQLEPSTQTLPPPGQDWEDTSLGEGPRFFQGAHDFVINNLSIVNQQVQGRLQVLKELQEHIIPGAEFNSAERDPPPRCHPGTRMSIREEVRAHVEDVHLRTRIIWIHGPAGVGKSAIMQTLAEDVSPRVVCATLFFSRLAHRDDARKVFATLAYNLAVSNFEYRKYVGTIIEDDPTCFTKSLDDQFRTFFVTPFLEKRIAAGSLQWVVLLDGLDECQNTEGSDNQCRIMYLISDSIFHHAHNTPFIWVIASRPEGNLRGAWSKIQHRFRQRVGELWEIAIPVNSDQATRDVELYLHQQFEAIRTEYSELISGPHWPSENEFLKIARKSSGLFIFSSTVIRYISDEDPVSRLRYIISLIDRMEQHPTPNDTNPFQIIDSLYSSILFDVSDHLFAVAKSLLGFRHLLSTVFARPSIWQERRKMKLVEACNILGLKQNEAYAALRKLQSVVAYPSPDTAGEDGVDFFHASFSDFLLDHSRSQKYHLDLDQALVDIWRSYTRIIQQSLGTQGLSEISLSWLPGNGASLRGGLQRNLLQKARSGWAQIVMKNSFPQTGIRKLKVDILELIEAFQSVGVAFLSGDRFPIEQFLTWIDNEIPSTFQDRIISQRFPLNQLDTERLFRALCVTPRYQYGMNSDVWELHLTASIGVNDPSQWARVKALLWSPSGDFRELVKAFDKETVRVTVVGIEPSASCAIIGPFLNGYGNNFYVLPYSVI